MASSRPGSSPAMYPLIFMVSCPLEWQKQAPTRERAEAFLEARIQRYASANGRQRSDLPVRVVAVV